MNFFQSKINNYFNSVRSCLEKAAEPLKYYTGSNKEKASSFRKKLTSFKEKIEECRSTCLKILDESQAATLEKLNSENLNRKLFPKFCFRIEPECFIYQRLGSARTPDAGDPLGYLIVVDGFLSSTEIHYYKQMAMHFYDQKNSAETCQVDEKYFLNQNNYVFESRNVESAPNYLLIHKNIFSDLSPNTHIIETTLRNFLTIETLELRVVRLRSIMPNARFLFENVNKLLVSYNFDIEEGSYSLKRLIQAFSNSNVHFLAVAVQFIGDEIPPDAFQHLHKLPIDELVLNENKIRCIGHRALTGLQNLHSLSLSGMNIENLSEHVFDSVPNLRKLDLGYNKLDKLSKNLFAKLKKLEILRTSVNPFRKISSKCFENLTKLNYLDMSDCRIEELNDNWFRNLKSLKRLSLKNNSIINISDRALSGLNNLMHLDLEGNRLITIGPNVFTSLNMVWSLSLARNRLIKIDPRIFESLKELRIIDLSLNKLLLVEENTFDEAAQLRHVGMVGVQLPPFLFNRTYKNQQFKLYSSVQETVV